MRDPNNLQTAVRRELSLETPTRLRRRSPLLRLTAATALLCALGAATALAQPPYQEELLPGVTGLKVGGQSSPELADMDGDGDFDAVVGESSGRLVFFENSGSSNTPAYVERTGSNNPFDAFDVGLRSSPGLGDLDGDGDLDVVVGDRYGLLAYLENTGSPSAPAFVQRTGAANPWNGADIGTNSFPELADPDGDGDLDAIVGHDGGTLRYYENTGGSGSPAYLERTGTSNPFATVLLELRTIPELVDLDGDGDLDVVTGGFTGRVRYVENTGSTSAPAFVERSGASNPFDGIDLGVDTYPDLTDLDGDGDLDALVGEYYGSLRFLENTGSSSAPAFVERTDSASPFFNPLISRWSGPDLGDLDGDGDLELVIGERAGRLVYLENTGSPGSLGFMQGTGSANPFDGIAVGGYGYSSPCLADLDGDGDLDVVVGEYYGKLQYFENTGSSSGPAFAARTGSANPFNGLDVGFFSTPDLADLDGDSDLDAVVGRSSGVLQYYRNTGTSLGPSFVELAGTANPFNALSVGPWSHPELVDLDDDGDLDVVVGELSGAFRYFENTGTPLAPALVARTGSSNPLDGLTVGQLSSPNLVDLDADGDLDLLTGELYGRVVFFRSLLNLFADGFESGDTSAWSLTVPGL